MLAHTGPHAFDLVMVATAFGLGAVAAWFGFVRRRDD